MLNSVKSKSGKLIRLTDERWAHITEEHCEIAGLRTDVLDTVGSPDKIVMGIAGELLAAKEIIHGKLLIVVYRELEGDGFIITAFITSKVQFLSRRKCVWP